MGNQNSVPDDVLEISLSFLSIRQWFGFSLCSTDCKNLVISKLRHLSKNEIVDIQSILQQKLNLNIHVYFQKQSDLSSCFIDHKHNVVRLLNLAKDDAYDPALTLYLLRVMTSPDGSSLHKESLRSLIDTTMMNSEIANLLKHTMKHQASPAIYASLDPICHLLSDTPTRVLEQEMYMNKKLIKARRNCYANLFRPVCCCCGVRVRYDSHTVCSTCFVVDPWYVQCENRIEHNKNSLCDSCYNHAKKHVELRVLPAMDTAREERLHGIVSKAISQLETDWEGVNISLSGKIKTEAINGRSVNRKRKRSKFEMFGSKEKPIMLCDESLEEEEAFGISGSLDIKHQCMLHNPHCMILKHKKGPDDMMKHCCGCACHK